MFKHKQSYNDHKLINKYYFCGILFMTTEMIVLSLDLPSTLKID
jgi:hypothetical protein